MLLKTRADKSLLLGGSLLRQWFSWSFDAISLFLLICGVQESEAALKINARERPRETGRQVEGKENILANHSF